MVHGCDESGDPQNFFLIDIAWNENGFSMKQDRLGGGNLSKVPQDNPVVDSCIVPVQGWRDSFDTENNLIQHRKRWKFPAVGEKRKGTIFQLFQRNQNPGQKRVTYGFGAHKDDLF